MRLAGLCPNLPEFCSGGELWVTGGRPSGAGGRPSGAGGELSMTGGRLSVLGGGLSGAGGGLADSGGGLSLTGGKPSGPGPERLRDGRRIIVGVERVEIGQLVNGIDGGRQPSAVGAELIFAHVLQVLVRRIRGKGPAIGFD